MTERLPCCVPHCRSTRGLRRCDNGVMPTEWLCSRHWRPLAYETKRSHRRAVRRLQKRGPALGRILMAIKAWRACVAEAIERAGGI